jgi:hypothetical protein
MRFNAMTFIHRFSSSVQCEVTVRDEPPEADQNHVLHVEWTGQPKRKHLLEYIRWMNEVNRFLADRWNLSILHVFQLKPDPKTWQLWSYKPGQPPRRESWPISPSSQAA